MELNLCVQRGEEEEEKSKRSVQNLYMLPICSAYMSRLGISYSTSKAEL